MKAINFVNEEGLKRVQKAEEKGLSRLRWEYGLRCSLIEVAKEERENKNQNAPSLEEAMVLMKIRQDMQNLGLTL